VRELIETERTYVSQNLCEVVDGYYSYMEESKAEMSQALEMAADAADSGEGEGENTKRIKGQ
jgi:hypothetical protein